MHQHVALSDDQSKCYFEAGDYWFILVSGDILTYLFASVSIFYEADLCDMSCHIACKYDWLTE